MRKHVAGADHVRAGVIEQTALQRGIISNDIELRLGVKEERTATVRRRVERRTNATNHERRRDRRGCVVRTNARNTSTGDENV